MGYLDTVQPDPESAAGHRRSAGGVLFGLGLAFTLFAAAGLWLIEVQFGFISGEALLVIALTYVGLGYWMRVRPGKDSKERAE